MTEQEFDELWKPVKSVIELCHLDYGAAVTIGGSFGKLKATIMEQTIKIKHLEEAANKYYKLEAYGVDNWHGYSEAMNDSEGLFEEEEE